MKHAKHFLFTMAMLLFCLAVSAHDFEVNGIYYNFSSSSDLTVEVTYKGYRSEDYSNEYAGAVIIPSTVDYEGRTYSVISIGEEALSYCEGLTSIIISDGVTTIGYGAFKKCSSLTSVTIPKNVASIGGSAFYGCSNLESIITSESITSIGGSAFEGTAWYNKLSEGVVYVGKVLYAHKGTMPENTSIKVKEGIVSITSSAFEDYGNLISVTIPEGVTKIGPSAFNGCSNLTSINIPEGVVSIEYEVFSGCSSLTSINLPLSVTNIGYGAFAGCNSLSSITFPENSPLTSIEADAFSGCSNLSSITIPENVTKLNGYNIFYNCSNLTTITILGSLTQVHEDAFRECNNLKEMIFGEKVRQIGSGAFSEIESIEKVIVHATQPPRTDGDIFSNEVYDNATLYVPQGSISKYQVMTGWSGFYNISEIEGGTPDYLTIRQADNGEVGIAVDLGRTYRVRIAASEGWKVHSVTFDGVDMTAKLSDDNTFTTPTLNGSAVLNVAYEQVSTKVEGMHSQAVKVRGYQDKLFISGTESGDQIAIYTAGGAVVEEVKAEGADSEISVESGQLYIVKVAGKVVKIQM